MAMTVYCLWMNDSLIGIYGMKEMARLRLNELKAGNKDDAWRQVRDDRWAQPEGRIARLEITAERVR